ncbi:MAG: META domain-containing protein [Pseudomonadota bacterium]
MLLRLCAWALALMLFGVGLTSNLQAEVPAGLQGRWLAEDLQQRGVIDNLQSTLEINAEGQASGSAGCNRFTGALEVTGGALDFGPLAVTRMACLPSVNDQEARFLEALDAARSYRLEQGLLYLDDEAGTAVARFSRME